LAITTTAFVIVVYIIIVVRIGALVSRTSSNGHLVGSRVLGSV
jgi:hypothetical protein